MARQEAMSAADLIVMVFIMGSVFTAINLWLMHSVANLMLSQMKSQLSEFALYINSLNNYSQALQDLKDKELFDSINRKGTGGKY